MMPYRMRFRAQSAVGTKLRYVAFWSSPNAPVGFPVAVNALPIPYRSLRLFSQDAFSPRGMTFRMNGTGAQQFWRVASGSFRRQLSQANVAGGTSCSWLMQQAYCQLGRLEVPVLVHISRNFSKMNCRNSADWRYFSNTSLKRGKLSITLVEIAE